jgi:hypothetical protein
VKPDQSWLPQQTEAVRGQPRRIEQPMGYFGEQRTDPEFFKGKLREEN